MNLWGQAGLIFCGAGCGGLARWTLALTIDSRWAASCAGLPIGTMAVNILGSTAIGLVAGLLSPQHPLYSLLVLGLLGGFTTFSSFSLQSVNLFTAGRSGAALLVIGLSLICCLAGTWAGMLFVRSLTGSSQPTG